MFRDDITASAKKNINFRKVLYTTPKSQVVLMSLWPNEDIGEETHPKIDQIFFCAAGRGESVISHKPKDFGVGDIVVVPAGTLHNIKNTGKGSLKLITIYTPPAHPDGTTNLTKEIADKDDKPYKGA